VARQRSRQKIQFKGLSGFVDGEKLLCLAGAEANPVGAGFFGNSIVLHVPYSSLPRRHKGRLRRRGLRHRSDA
jgi:hypothetical protein